MDLEHRVVAGTGRVGESEVVGGGLSSHRQTGRLGFPDHGHRHASGQVLKVDPGTSHASQGDVPHHHELLGLGRLAPYAEAGRPGPFVHITTLRQGSHFAVLGQDHRMAKAVGQTGAVLHETSHDLRVLYPGAVVSEHSDAGVHQFAHRGHLVTATPDRHSRRRNDLAGRRFAKGPHLFDDRHAVGGRFCVGHGHQGGIAAKRSGPGTGFDGFGLLVAWLA